MSKRNTELYDFFGSKKTSKNEEGPWRRMFSIIWRNIRSDLPAPKTKKITSTNVPAPRSTQKSAAAKKAAESKAEDRYVHFSLSYETLALCALGFVCLLVVAYGAGKYRGTGKLSLQQNVGPIPTHPLAAAKAGAKLRTISASGDASREPASHSSNTAARSNTIQRPKPFYTVQVIGAIPRKNAEQIKNYLKYNGGDVFTRRSRSGKYVVFCGKFATKDDPRLHALQANLRKIKFNGRLAFKDSYIIRLMP